MGTRTGPARMERRPRCGPRLALPDGMTLRPACAVFALALALAPAGAGAKVTRKSVAKIWPAHSALALDANGVPHLAYQSPDHRPYHAVLVGNKFASERVENASDAGWDSALGVDGQGHVHLAYHAERMSPSYAQRLVYAFSDGGPWQIEEVDDGGYATSLALDAEDRAHLLYTDGSGNLSYAIQEDVGWELHATGLTANWFRTTSLALDADGHAHASYVRNGGLFGVEAYYATDASGDWEETLLGTHGGQLASLALDAGGKPWIALLTNEAVRLFHDDGMGFVEEPLLDFASVLPGFTIGPDGVALALDAGGRPYVVATIFASSGARGTELQLFLTDDGEGWVATLLGSKNEGFDPVLAVGADGAVEGIWRSGGESSAKLSYFAATFPDLAGAWSGVASGAGQVTATLTVENQGSDKSKGAPVALYLSDDAVLDGGDALLPAKLKVGGLAPDASRALSVAAAVTGPASGRYLIAVIDPGKTNPDLDRADNTVAALVP